MWILPPLPGRIRRAAVNKPFPTRTTAVANYLDALARGDTLIEPWSGVLRPVGSEGVGRSPQALSKARVGTS